MHNDQNQYCLPFGDDPRAPVFIVSVTILTRCHALSLCHCRCDGRAAASHMVLGLCPLMKSGVA